MDLIHRIIQILLLTFLFSSASGQSDKRPLPGPQGYLLPNGWTLTPAGKQIEVGDLPMNIVVEPSGRHAFVLNSGWNEHTVSVIDLGHNQKIQEVSLDRSWLGLCFDPRESRLYVSGGARPIIEVLAYDPTHQEAPLAKQAPIALDSTLMKKVYISGLALDAKGKRLFAANTEEGTLIEVDLKSGRTLRRLSLGGVPYTCLLSKDGHTVYVSLWNRKGIALVDRASWTVRKAIAVGSHPNDLAMTPDGQRLFVANANSNSVSVVALKKEKVSETIVTTLFPKAPQGSTPNALAISPDGQTLFVANADNNNIAWVDISKVGESEIRGFIPTGWYPSAVGVTTDGERILVGNGKGTVSSPNPRGPQPIRPRTSETEYIGRITLGAVSIIPRPIPDALARYTRQVYRNTPYRDRLLEQTKHKSPLPEVVPDRVGTPSSRIEYVIYIIKENRTYDQVLGDVPQGNGDPSLTLFGEKITPNHHALAREFVLLDNFYVDAEVSVDGHSWSMAAYATDYAEKAWPAGYAGRGRMLNLYYPGLYTPDRGFIWDLCAKAGISYRSYGEMVTERDGRVEARFPGLVGHIHPTYTRRRSLAYTDLERAEDWVKEFKQFEKEGRVPRLQILALPDDHTSGTRPGHYTPFVQVARNDLALGRIVETASRSSLWHKMTIFVVEDDAQNGPDHVDARRTVAFVISPYSRLRKVDSTFYTTSSMLRTIELVLGLPPMSQYDAAATPMFECFSNRLDLEPYRARPAQIDLTTKNTKTAYGAKISAELPLDDVDEAPDDLFSEIIWKAVKGADSEMPPPVRRARLVPLAALE
ncbi:beta-propeller fold lactonase family protein [Acidobacteria bacterium AH-259-L09]|nr:beta-propeller fold lactonase family protein [Acidobacteria bacterium AH-259-L09]